MKFVATSPSHRLQLSFFLLFHTFYHNFVLESFYFAIKLLSVTTRSNQQVAIPSRGLVSFLFLVVLFFFFSHQMATSSQIQGKSAKARPPEKGSFPLDHFGKCTPLANAYKECLKDNDNVTLKCRELAKLYLECRMKNNLMAQEDWGYLGFRESDSEIQVPEAREELPVQGHIAGTAKFKKKKENLTADHKDSNQDDPKAH